ncbi:MAG: hypothetical protein UGF45_13370 [Massilioclostridium sp.]|nr:hypothetical protein [Massilioclostridium sp.]MEE1492956.1 hypothetical protein [Massilioclostridium sp.]
MEQRIEKRNDVCNQTPYKVVDDIVIEQIKTLREASKDQKNVAMLPELTEGIIKSIDALLRLRNICYRCKEKSRTSVEARDKD